MLKISDAEFLRQIVKCASVSDNWRVYIDQDDQELLLDISERIESRGPLPAGLERLAEVIEEHASDRPRCETCSWWTEVAGQDRGECRRRPPVATDEWTRTRPTDWCGEHSRGAGGRSGASGGGCGSGGCSRASSSS